MKKNDEVLLDELSFKTIEICLRCNKKFRFDNPDIPMCKKCNKDMDEIIKIMKKRIEKNKNENKR